MPMRSFKVVTAGGTAGRYVARSAREACLVYVHQQEQKEKENRLALAGALVDMVETTSRPMPSFAVTRGSRIPFTVRRMTRTTADELARLFSSPEASRAPGPVPRTAVSAERRRTFAVMGGGEVSGSFAARTALDACTQYADLLEGSGRLPGRAGTVHFVHLVETTPHPVSRFKVVQKRRGGLSVARVP